MRIAGTVVDQEGVPVEGLLVQLFQGPDADTVRLSDLRRIGRSVTAQKGSFELSLDGLADDAWVLLVVGDRASGTILFRTAPRRISEVPDTIDIKLERAVPEPSDVLDPEPPTRDTGRSRVVGLVNPGGQKPRTVEIRVVSNDRRRTVASAFIGRRGEFMVDVTKPLRRIGDDVKWSLVLLGASGSADEKPLHERSIEPIEDGDLAVSIDLRGDRPTRPDRPRPQRPQPPADPSEAGVLVEGFDRSRVALEAIGDRLVTQPYLKLRPSAAAEVESATQLRQRVLRGERGERFVPTRRPQSTRDDDVRFVDGTLESADRLQGRFLAQLGAVQRGVERLSGADRGALRYRFDPDRLAAIEGARRNDGAIEVPAEAVFEHLRRRVPAPLERREHPPGALERLQACIDGQERNTDEENDDE